MDRRKWAEANCSKSEAKIRRPVWTDFSKSEQMYKPCFEEVGS